MKRILLTACALAFLVATSWAVDPPRDANKIMVDYVKVKMPAYDSAKQGDRDYLRSYSEQRTKAIEKQNELALELYRSHPKDERAIQVMMTRWRNMRGDEKSLAEMEEFLKEHPESPKKLDVMYTRAMAVINTVRPDMAKGEEFTEELIRAFPKDERGASLLSMIAMRKYGNKEAQRAVYGRIAADYAGSRAAKMAEGSIRRLDAVGQPFELTFTDAMKGETVSMKGLAGKVVVVDFWATWCGPCIAEMPKMKELYAKYKDQGVEFIGVSLDQPGEGLTALKKYVEESNIQWPQYYQGKGGESEFSVSWGINLIPSLFVVDAEGNLASTEARSRLETLIPELIKKRDEKKSGG